MTCSQELENIDQVLTHRVDTLCPGQTLARLRGEGLPQRRLRPENLSGVSPGDRRLRLGDRPHHATLRLVEHEAVVVNIELVVTNDTLLVRSFLLNLNKKGLIIISSDVISILTNLMYLKSSVLCSLVFLDKSSDT